MVQVTGSSICKSIHGYLPGDIYPFSLFYQYVSYLYVTLGVTYGTMMITYRNYSIPIEKYILLSISIGLCEMMCRYKDLDRWN
jgi:Lung seven transmembrane receptor